MRINPEKYLNRIKEIVNKNIDTDNTSVFLFGSRTGQCSDSSDVDIGLLSSDPAIRKTIIRIKSELEESRVPFHVDIVDFNKVSEEFKDTALKKIIIWNKGKFLN